MNISLICTVKNEADNIAALLDSMLAQTRTPDEIVVNDCGSTDNTAAIVQSYIDRGAAIKLVAGGFNISSGRNNAINHATHSIIASTDAGLALDPHWLERIVAPIERGEADLVAGFYQAAPTTLVETVIGATNYPLASEVNPQKFLAAGQSVAFRKTAWEHVGGYPEWLDHCEDLVFDQAIARAGFKTTTVLDAVVHFTPRSSFKALARQYFFYARGDGIADLWRKRHAIRYTTYVMLVVLLLAARHKPALVGLIMLGGYAYTRQPYRRLWRATQGWSWARRSFAMLMPPLVRVVGDVAKMVGYPIGVWHRKAKK